MRVAVITDDKYLYRRIELELAGTAEVTTDVSEAELFVIDTDGDAQPVARGACVTLSRRGKADLPIPFLRGSLRALLEGGGESTARLLLDRDARVATLDGRAIPLTRQEAALLAFLIDKGGDFASREEISRAVWGGASDGLINIYVHYLREKLEGSGERIILSSRSQGYRISEKFLEVKVC